ncbi:MAG: hypothetical protein AB1Z98_24180 [Nannocystaceae bacterium]
MRIPNRLKLVLPLVIAAHGCNETSPTTAPEPGNAAPALPGDDAADAADADEEAGEVFDDEPEPEDERDVLDGG